MKFAEEIGLVDADGSALPVTIDDWSSKDTGHSEDRWEFRYRFYPRDRWPDLLDSEGRWLDELGVRNGAWVGETGRISDKSQRVRMISAFGFDRSYRS